MAVVISMHIFCIAMHIYIAKLKVYYSYTCIVAIKPSDLALAEVLLEGKICHLASYIAIQTPAWLQIQTSLHAHV